MDHQQNDRYTSSYNNQNAQPYSGNVSSNTTPPRSGSPNTDSGRNPFGETPEPAANHRLATNTGTNPFVSPAVSRPASSFGSSSALGPRFEERAQRYFHSRRVAKGEVEKPWLQKKDKKEKWVTIIPIIGILIGLGISGFLVWDGLRSVVHHKYCPLIDDSFDNGLDTGVWTKEVQLGGFGNGEFEMTTPGDENVYVDGGNLIIKATLQDADKMEKTTTIDLKKDGTCTSDDFYDCVAVTNTTAGNSSVVPPVKSGRIHTKKGATLKYGRVEVTAKLPQGDWLWPAIWMMPVKDTYGPWPASGEIDIMESRGNNWTYAQGGNNIVSSALHWGPDPANDAWWKTNNKHKILRGDFGGSFNTFGLEWSQKYLFTYVNTRLMQVLYTNFNKPMWQRGAFPQTTSNGTRLADVWSQTGRKNTPFDQDFYLIINLAVGGTNGWFEDNKSLKPWVNGSPNAKKDFWAAREDWHPTWKQPQMEIQRVVIQKQCDGDEEL
ncbi:glucan 1,3-beta-glucosidase [Beauveria brongniartii RCEF 3172]|uniref:Glucan 1,3-beta-glucosidase n=1 Tax=Beauveria brongniartii RCEF 3172 TaxID=1081107 RepID=A0A162K214_9HYPO|nr:glucan 1,3-beta-glucosidase [Beauveria brongniartii RCEF 3172]